MAKKVDGPPRPASPSAEIVDAPPSGAEELGRVEVIGFDGEACKAEAKERARTLLGASHVVVASHPAPFDWQNTQTETVAAPRCVGTGYLAAPGALVPAPTPAAAPPPDMAPAPTPPPATPPPAT